MTYHAVFHVTPLCMLHLLVQGDRLSVFDPNFGGWRVGVLCTQTRKTKDVTALAQSRGTTRRPSFALRRTHTRVPLLTSAPCRHTTHSHGNPVSFPAAQHSRAQSTSLTLHSTITRQSVSNQSVNRSPATRRVLNGGSRQQCCGHRTKRDRWTRGPPSRATQNRCDA